MGEYQIEKTANGYSKDFMTFLKENAGGAIVDDDGVINVKNLLGKKLSTGNGTNLKDVYVLEEIIETAKLASTQMVKIAETEDTEKSYTLKYYSTATVAETEPLELATVGKPVTPVESEPSVEPTDSKYFEFEYDDIAKTATLKGINPDYMPEISYSDLVDGEYVEKTMKNPAYIKVDGTNKITNIVIPNKVKKGDITYTVTAIAKEAFAITLEVAMSEIENVTIPNTVTNIGEQAFFKCAKLTSMTIPKSVTSIGESAFSECTALTTVSMSEGVTSIEAYTFYTCTALTTVAIPNGVTSIGEGAFGYCQALTTVTMPNSVTSIEKTAFTQCRSLTAISIPNSVTSIGQYAFSGCKALATLTISGGVTSIGNSAFSGCNALTTVIIPNSVASIGEKAFWSCELLETATISDGVTSIGKGAFGNYKSLTTVAIPNSVTSIGEQAFLGCEALTTATIPNGVTIIEKSLFKNCVALATIEIPANITNIKEQAFYGCNQLKTVYYMGMKEQWLSPMMTLGNNNEPLISAENIICIDGVIENLSPPLPPIEE